MATLTTYVIEVTTPGGIGEMEVPTTLGPESAERRALFAAASIRFGGGDLDTITVQCIGKIVPQ